jgi:hypothetical protein
LALAHSAGWTTNQVPYEDLVLQAWRDFPGDFSLRNHPEHPDASDIHKRLYQTLRPKGYVVSLGNKVFRLTDSGLVAARAIQPSEQATMGTPNKRLARDEQAFLERAFASRAFRTWNAGHPDELIEFDARLFFEFSTGTPVAERALRVESAERAIDKASELSLTNAADLAALVRYLTIKFGYLWL